jgi:hypothetical protein
MPNNNKSSTDKNESSVLHPGAHVPGSLGKKTAYINPDCFGTSLYPGQVLQQDSTRDQLRMDFDLFWTPEKLKTGQAVVDSTGHSTSYITGVKNSYNNQASFKQTKYIAVSPEEPTLPNISSLFNVDGDLAFYSRSHRLLIDIEYTPMIAEDFREEFLKLIQNNEHHPGKAQAFFRSHILGKDHAMYVLEGLIAEDSQITEKEIIQLYEQHFGKIRPVFDPARIYEDHYLEISAPFHKEELEALNDVPRAMQINIEPSYNFYEEKYEATLQNLGIANNTKYLPNMYMMLQNEYESSDPSLEKLITVGDLISTDLVQVLNEKGNKKKTQISNEYFKQWGLAHQKAIADSDSAYQNLLLRNSNLIFLMNKSNYLKDFNQFSDKFPMANTISLKTHTHGPLGATLQKTKLDLPLLRSLQLANTYPESSYGVLEPYSFKTMIKGHESLTVDDQANLEKNNFTVVNKNIKCVDMQAWLKDFTESAGDIYLSRMGNPNASTRILGENISAADFADDSGLFLRKLISSIFSAKLNQIAEKTSRTHKEIFSGKAAHHEVIAYRVAKHRVVDGTLNQDSEQNFYFGNPNEIEDLIYHDTQVAYGSEFKYFVYAYVLAVGSKYAYRGTAAHHTLIPPGATGAFLNYSQGLNTYSIMAHTIPDIKMYEVPYYGFEEGEQSTGFMFDDPPVPPEVDIGGYRGVNNKIHITLSNSYGNFIEKPVVLEDKDSDSFAKIRRYQSLSKKQVAAGKIRFKTDDLSNRFEVFRIGPDILTGETKKPAGYSDFQRRKIKIVNDASSDSAAFVDTLEPNKKYYYTFRSTDQHNNASNPTQVYEVELINNPTSNLSYVTVAPYNFKDILSPRIKKSMRRFLHVEPRFEQKAIDFDLEAPNVNIEEVISSPPSLGILKDSLFVDAGTENKDKLKKFKIRLTSKRSGKKIDINIKFVREYNKHKKPQVF